MEISVRELKSHLSEYLRRARTGEQLTVTSHGKAIAVLGPISERGTSEDGMIRELEAMPWIIAAKKRGKPEGAERPAKVPEGTIDEIMDWLR